MSKRPAFQFYPSDWLTDLGLRMCSIEARAVWMDMLCFMHQSEPYGYLDQKIEKKLQKICGISPQKLKKILVELEENDVFSRDEKGIFSRRMVRDEEIRESRSNAGKAGAEHGYKGAEYGKMGGRPPKNNTPQNTENVDAEGGFSETRQKPPPSSSSSIIRDNTQTFYTENPRAKKPESQNPRNEPQPNPKFAKFIHAAGMANFPSDLGKMLDLWERDGMDFDFTVIPAVERLAEKRRKDGGKQPYTASYFDSAVREMFAEDKALEAARERRLADNAKIENQMKERDIREATSDVEWVLDWRKTPPGTDGRPIDRLLDEAWDKAVATFHRYDVPVPVPDAAEAGAQA